MSLADKCCFWVILIGFLYFFGFNNIMDFFVHVFSYIPIFGYVFGYVIAFLKTMYQFIPFYLIYCILFTGLNLVYHAFMSRNFLENYRYDKTRALSYIFSVLFISILVPILLDFLFVDKNFVLSILVPLHLTITVYNLKQNRI